MDKKYLLLLAQKFPTIDSAASEIVNLSAIRSMPKGMEYFFSDIHGEYEAFLHMLKSASGMIKNKIDLTLGKTVSSAEREALAYLIYYPDKQLKRLRDKNGLSHSLLYPFFRYVSRARSMVSSGSIVSSILSLPTSASHILNGSAFGDGID